jgi:hypothetical protein
MKRLAILSALVALVFVALLAGGVANNRRSARERERILVAPVFPDAPRRTVVESFEGLRIELTATERRGRSERIDIVDRLDVECVRREDVSPDGAPDEASRVWLLVAEGSPSARRIREFWDRENPLQYRKTEWKNEDTANRFLVDRTPGGPVGDIELGTSEGRAFRDRWLGLVAEIEADVAARGSVRTETSAVSLFYEHGEPHRTYERQTWINRCLSRIGLAEKQTREEPVPAAWTNRPSFRLSPLNVVVEENLPAPAVWFSDMRGHRILLLAADSPAAAAVRALLEKRLPWRWRGLDDPLDQSGPLGTLYLRTFHDGREMGHYYSADPDPELEGLLLDLRRILVEQSATRSPEANGPHAESAEGAELEPHAESAENAEPKPHAESVEGITHAESAESAE